MPDTYTVERNGLIKGLDQYSLVKGKSKGQKYPAPTVDFSSPAAIENELTWFGLKNVANVIQTFYKRTFQDLWFGNIGADGLINEAKFLEEAKTFDAAGMKLKEINEKLSEAQEEMGMRVEKATDEEMSNPTWLTEMKELREYIKLLKSMAEDRSRKRKADTDEADAEPSVKVA